MTIISQRARRASAAVVLLAAGLVTTGGTALAQMGPSGSSGAAEQPCVPNVKKVVSTKLPESAKTSKLPDKLVKRIDAAAKSSLKALAGATPGAIVGVRSPKGTFIKAYGLSDRETGVPMTTDLHTRIGSVTKTFTGTVILQLAEEGKLSLDDTIDEYWPGVPNGDRITLRQMADMTSGIASYTFSQEFGERLFGDPVATIPVDDLIAYGLAESPLFEPGAMYNYSNTNFILLGKVIEEVTGKPAFDVIRERIIEPLGLTETSWPGDTTILPSPYAQGYTEQGETATPELPANSTHWNPSWAWTAGGLVSDIDDLLTYGRALGTGQGLLGKKMATERLTSFPPSLGQYAYGLAVACVDGWVGHTGELPGYNTSLYHDTTTDTTVITMVNSDIAAGACSESPTLTDDPITIACHSPSGFIEAAVTQVLGHPFYTPTEH
jgi:D-alanyl-D-alanine carboxypeptidase